LAGVPGCPMDIGKGKHTSEIKEKKCCVGSETLPTSTKEKGSDP